jgi:hypothetical protein
MMAQHVHHDAVWGFAAEIVNMKKVNKMAAMQPAGSLSCQQHIKHSQSFPMIAWTETDQGYCICHTST